MAKQETAGRNNIYRRMKMDKTGNVMGR